MNRTTTMGFGDSFERTALAHLKEQLRTRLTAIRHPRTGEFPTVVISGDSIETISARVEASQELLAVVRERTDRQELEAMQLVVRPASTPPQVFLSHASEDSALARRVAEALLANGIDTWLDDWGIGPGDSMRQRIDEGLLGCNHFLVLLTPVSIAKPWVNLEMDAGLIRRINEQARFIPIRVGLEASELPPLLSGMLSPTLGDFDVGIAQLVSHMHGVTSKPALGPLPAVVAEPETGYSPAAGAIARIFVDETETATFGDPQLTLGELGDRTGLSQEDVRDALHELRDYFTVSFEHVMPKDELFVIFDEHFKDWNPAADALNLAADLVNDDAFPSAPAEIADRYGWPARRLNPAIAFLENRNLAAVRTGLAMGEWAAFNVKQKKDVTRRFVKSRS